MTNLSFTKDPNGAWRASFVSGGNPVTMQLERVENGYINFFANIGGLDPLPIGSFSKQMAGKKFLRVINVPNGVTVTIESESEVVAGGYEE